MTIENRIQMQRNGNQIEIRTYAPPVITALQSRTLPLLDDWDTAEEIRWDIALVLAELSQAVYENSAERTDRLLTDLGFTEYIIIEKSPHYAFLARCADVTVVIMRGTDQFQDWLTNLDARFNRTANGRFHRGFQDAYQDVRQSVIDFLVEQPANKLWVAGHSLGGAMATLSAIDLHQNLQLEPTLVTFGQPRTGDNAAVRWIDSLFPRSYARFVHGNDIVPRVPPSLPFLRYGHAGKYIALHSDHVDIASSVEAITTTATMPEPVSEDLASSLSDQGEPVYQPAIELPPLSSEEFEQLRVTGFRIPVTIAPDAPQGALAHFGGSWNSFITDHYMDGYIRAISAAAVR